MYMVKHSFHLEKAASEVCLLKVGVSFVKITTEASNVVSSCFDVYIHVYIHVDG